MDIKRTISQMTTEEKAALVSGTNFMETNPIPRLKIPSLRMADGPHGLRKQIGTQDNGISQSEPATAFPTAVTTASSWNPENLRRIGEAIAKECRHYGVHILLGPGANIKRNPLCGRNFEYFSEDPCLAGEMGAAEVQGVQAQGVGVSVKHFAMNNAENFRFMGNSLADERAAREIYLKVFERIVKQVHPATMMCAYNKVNGTFASQNEWLLTDVLRRDWGFNGAVMTDWGAMHDRVASLKAGLDLEMPGDTPICRRWILDGIADGTLSREKLDEACTNILKLIADYVESAQPCEVNWEAHQQLAAEIAADSAVLLKNDGVLPLDGGKPCFVAGELFEKMRYQGSGSSMINATRVTSPKEAFDQQGVKYAYCRGYTENRTEPQEELIREAVRQAKQHETVLVFAGLTDYVESEGCDREHMRMPDNQLALIDALVQAGRKPIVVLYGGAPVELPFAEGAAAILHMFLPGQSGGIATAQLLFGERNPAGRLAETWPMSYADVPFGEEYSKGVNECYKESIYVGYRYYLSAGKKVRYPFGYGLSYTAFRWEDMHAQQADGCVTLTCRVTNTGSRAGAEVVQLYVKAPETAVFKPAKELRAFCKVYLAPQETKTVTLTFPVEELRIWHATQHRWVLEGGQYECQLCSDCETVRLTHLIHIDGETCDAPGSAQVQEIYRRADLSQVTNDVFEQLLGSRIPSLPPRMPITLESRFTDLKATFMGRILYKAVLSVAESQRRRAEKLPDGPERDNRLKGAMFLKRIFESNSLISMSMSAGGSMPYHFAQGFAALANGQLLRGAMCFLRPAKVPPLPRDTKED